MPEGDLFARRSAALQKLQRGEFDEAESLFTQLVELAPDDPIGHADLGLTYLRQSRFTEAQKELERARNLDPSAAELGLLLARLHAAAGRTDRARSLLEEVHRTDPKNLHALYALSELDAENGDSISLRRASTLKQLLAIAPANLAARLDLATLHMRRGDADSVVQQLEEIQRIPPAPAADVERAIDSAITLTRNGSLSVAGRLLARIAEAMTLTKPYQASLDDVKWVEGPISGTPLLSFAPTYLISMRGMRQRSTTDTARFTDVTDNSGLPERTGNGRSIAGEGAAPTTAAGDVDGDGHDELLVSSWSPTMRANVPRLYQVQGGFAREVTERAGIAGALAGGVRFATFADVDNDGWMDLVAITTDGRGVLLHNQKNGTFEDATAAARIADVRGATSALVVDIDHDGDLDLVLLGGPSLHVERNDGTGLFSDATRALGLSEVGAMAGGAFADLDGDGRVDLVLARQRGGVALLQNGGAAGFTDGTAASGLPVTGDVLTVAVGDYDNDGAFDLVLGSRDGRGTTALWRNRGAGAFGLDQRASAALRDAGGMSVLAAAFVDVDNNGWLDLVLGGTAARARQRGVLLFRGTGAGLFDNGSDRLPPAFGGAGTIVASDIDDDGDEDLIIGGAAAGDGVRLWRNDGGNARLAVNVRLKGLRTGSGKNNDFGIGSKIELRVGALRQTRVVTGRTSHFGLGPHLKADVLRVEWTNGVPQTLYFPGSDQDVVEYEMLKGSCAFAYTWDGKRFRFLTDVMWRSALGMPLGLMGGGAHAFAPAGASQEYLRIPGDALSPRDGRYVVQLTEELWETAYVDEIRLLAVDHPDSVDVFIDERFVPPGPVTLRPFVVGRGHAPESAVDGNGVDVLPALLASDDAYVSNLTPTAYQGVVEPHELILDLGANAGARGSRLFLRGWIYPTDASLNVALGQRKALAPSPPSLDVRDEHGHWRTAVGNLSFPSGKDKTLVIDLAGLFPTTDRRVRLRTTMQIYWNQAFVAHDVPDVPRMTRLPLVGAGLHSRGFSRMYRRGGRYGPYWFDYDSVTTDLPWRPITGAFTRFGDVRDLLADSDDKYVIMGPGDEVTLQFDAGAAAALPAGWRRDFFLYSDGWIKDSDLNTANGTTVGPLPYHAIRAYPYVTGDEYPRDADHDRYRREYNTRIVRRR